MAHLYIKCYAKVNDEERLIGMRFLKRNETRSEAENSYKKIYGNKVSYYNDVAACISKCNIIIIATEWDTIKNYDFNSIDINHQVFIYDFKSCINNKNEFNFNIKYWSLGGNKNGK